MKITLGENSLSLMVGDITKQTAEFIVNAANGSLLGGGGVDGAIHRGAGPKLLAANKQVRKNLLQDEYLPTGEAVITKGFNLPATYVIHTVGPIWENTGTEQELLANCYQNSLALAFRMNDEIRATIDRQGGFLSKDLNGQGNSVAKKSSIAFPSISTGVYRFPLEQAATIALGNIYQFLSENTFGDVTMVLFSEADFAIYEKVLKNIG